MELLKELRTWILNNTNLNYDKVTLYDLPTTETIVEYHIVITEINATQQTVMFDSKINHNQRRMIAIYCYSNSDKINREKLNEIVNLINQKNRTTNSRLQAITYDVPMRVGKIDNNLIEWLLSIELIYSKLN